jgi:hypothetical protein
VKNCIYKSSIGSCEYEKLTADDVSALEIAEVRNVKAYKIKAEAIEAKSKINLGLIAMRYSEFIQDSFPGLGVTHTVNGDEDQVGRVLRILFRLSDKQQDKFWEVDRFSAWKQRAGVDVSLSEIRSALSQVRT